MAIKKNDKDVVFGYNSRIGLYWLNCDVVDLKEGKIQLRSFERVTPTGIAPHSETFTVPEHYFDKTVEAREAQIAGEAQWLAKQFSALSA